MGDLVAGAVRPGGAGESAESVVGVSGDAVRPVSDGFQQVAGIVSVVDLLAVWVSEPGEVIVGVVFVLDQITIRCGECFEPATAIIGASESGRSFANGEEVRTRAL